MGILLEVKDHSELAAEQLKPIGEILDSRPLMGDALLALSRWAANYYQHPLGDVFSNVLPTLLRQGKALITEQRWQLTTEGKGLPEGALKSAKKQAELIKLLQQQKTVSATQLREKNIKRPVLNALIDKGLIEIVSENFAVLASSHYSPANQPLTLNEQQQNAVDSVNAQTGFGCFLLEGVTGSGKTEVYLQLIDQVLRQGLQALVLIPEIGLTPQTFSRFQQRFNCPIALLHSGLTDRERLLAWQQAATGEAGIIIGTRSAVFTPLARPGLIIIDEEHDSSFKQQDGFRYSARDIAIKRASDHSIPILLGSATPSLETLHNALQGRYHHLSMTQRATGASSPKFELLDIRNAALEEGFSPELIAAIKATIKAGNQALVFINRRGFSPVLMCQSCGFIAQCTHCDARMTVHYQQRLLRCHHCEFQQRLPDICPNCSERCLDFKGAGTERSEQALQRLFPNTGVIRIDRDTTSKKQAMETMIEEINRGEPCILVGTQMLAKGHHFADVTLVAILDADGGLFSADFRGPEKMGQLLVQVAGRAGRASKSGRVLIQTLQPEHPLINALVNNSYQHYARKILAERQQFAMPPYGYLALVRADANNLQKPEQFLQQIKQQLIAHQQVKMLGPLPAPMTRRAGRYRVQLLLQSQSRKPLHHCLQQLCTIAEQHPLASNLRWSIDVDPIDAF